jgi:hypothetical protein
MTRKMPLTGEPIVPPDGGAAVPYLWPPALFRLGLVILGPVTVENLALMAAFLHGFAKTENNVNDWVECTLWILAQVALAGGKEVSQ